MLDTKLLRTDLEATAAKLAKRGYTLDVDYLSGLENRRKELQIRTQELQNRRNSRSKAIGKAKIEGADIQPLLDEVTNLGDELKQVEQDLTVVQEQLRQAQLDIPNIPHKSVPLGRNETNNIEIRRWGGAPSFRL